MSKIRFRENDRKHFSYSGQRCYLAKLTDRQAVAIVKKSRKGACQTVLARQYGVTRNAIWNLLNGKSWVKVLKIKGLRIVSKM